MDADLTATQIKAVNASWTILEALREGMAYEDGDSQESNRMVQYHSQMAFLEGIRLHLYPDIILPLIDEGKSVVVFLRYRSSLDALNALLTPEKIPTSFILGGQSEKTRLFHVEQFQSNAHPLCLCMLPAGGVGLSLHDLHGRQRYSLLSPSFDATQFKQALGRIHRIGSKSKAIQAIIYLANTREEQIAAGMQDRLKSLDLLNDGVTNKLSITDMELD
jgi:SNF2 family DNA or RNA helicase